MKNFFAKHRHLIVISLIIAVILVALTPLVVPLGLELEDRIDLSAIELPSPGARLRKLDGEFFESYTIRCDEHPVSEEQRIFLGSDKWTRTSDVQELCTILNDAPTERNTEKFRGFEIMKIWLHWRELGGQEVYSLIDHNGRYSLQGPARNGETVRWYISEEAAWALLEHRFCQAEPDYLENPRAVVCDAENIASVSILSWTDGRQTTPEKLTQQQIDRACAFMEQELLPARYSRPIASEQTYPSGKNGWQLTFTTQDETIWLVQYNDEQGCLSLCRVSYDSQPARVAAGYHYSDKKTVATLPDLLEDAP